MAAPRTPRKRAEKTPPTIQVEKRDDRYNIWDKRVRDMIIFGIGAVSLYRIFIMGVKVDPWVMAGSFMLVGLPFAFGADGLLNKKRDG